MTSPSASVDYGWRSIGPIRKTSRETQRSLQKFLKPTRKPRVIYTDNSLEFGKASEDLFWTIVRQHHPGQKQMGFLREQCAEWKTAPLLYCCNQVWIKVGGQILWIVTPICETWQIYYLMGRRPTKDVWATIWRTNFPIWFIGWALPYHSERPIKNPSVWKESLTWIVLRIRFVRSVIWKSDVMVADLEELQTMDASEIYSKKKRLNAKEVTFHTEEGEFIFPAASRRNNLLEEMKTWEHQSWYGINLFQGESNIDFLGESEGSLPSPHDSFPDAGDAINDFWSMSGNTHIPPSRWTASQTVLAERRIISYSTWVPWGTTWWPAFLISNSNFCKKTRILQKTPKFRKMAIVIFLSELILAFFLYDARTVTSTDDVWSTMINTALSSPGPNSRFLCRSSIEHVYGILLDEKFLYRSVHAAFVNTKLYEAWLERTLLLDPIIFDMWIPGVLSWAPARHTSQDTLVVPCLRFGSFLNHKSVGGRGCGHQPDAFFPLYELPRRRGESLVGVRVHRSCWLSLTSSLCVFSEYHHCLCFLQSIAIAWVSSVVSLRVPPLLEFLWEYHSCFVSLRVPQLLAQHAHAVFARMSDHGPPNPQFFSTSITKIDGSCSSSSDWRCAMARRAFVTFVNTHILAASLCVAFCRTMEQRRHGRWRSNGSTVAQPLRLYCQPLQQSHCHFLRVCSCVTLPSQVHRRQTPSTSSSCSGWATLVSSVRTRHISWSSL